MALSGDNTCVRQLMIRTQHGGMAMTSSNCKGCKERAINCHATCASYQEYVKVHEKEKQEYREDMGIKFESTDRLKKFFTKMKDYYSSKTKKYRP